MSDDVIDPRAGVVAFPFLVGSALFRGLVRLFVDIPVAGIRALRTDEWTIEAISWAPYRRSYTWQGLIPAGLHVCIDEQIGEQAVQQAIQGERVGYMRMRIGVLALGVVLGAAGLISGAGASTQRVAIPVSGSSKAVITKYLVSVGLDARGIVVQRGAHNYAGPNCPGRGWTCTTAKRVLQIAAKGSDNQFECTASTGPGSSSSPPNDCTIVQVSTGGNNRARCVERSGDASVAQSCRIKQSNTTGDNRLDISQRVDAKDGATQAASQYAGSVQENGSGSNDAQINQDLKQSTKDTDASGAQTQNDHQQVSVTQWSETGDNSAHVDQSLALKAEASRRTSISQSQNTDGDLNTSAAINQNSTSGRNDVRLNQSNDYDAHVGKADSADQQQGSPGGGLAVFLNQSSTGLSTIHAKQREHQDLHAEHVGSLTQTQYGPMWADPSQYSNPGNRYDIDQSSHQHASNPTFQDDRAFGQCETSGNCTIDQRIQQQGQNNTNSCSGTSCDIGLTVTTNSDGTSTSTCTGSVESEVSCTTPPPPPPPPFGGD